jgi:hypothetical protein
VSVKQIFDPFGIGFFESQVSPRLDEPAAAEATTHLESDIVAEDCGSDDHRQDNPDRQVAARGKTHREWRGSRPA